MKPEKMRQLVREVLEARDAIPEHPVTFDQLTISFKDRTVALRGRVIKCDTDAVVFPVLSTDRMVVLPRGGEVV